jgi:hypothetical protein
LIHLLCPFATQHYINNGTHTSLHWIHSREASTGASVDFNGNATGGLTSEGAGDERVVCGWGPMFPQNFDNVGRALLTLFEISTAEGWLSIANGLVDVRAVNMQPVPGFARFRMVWMMVGLVSGVKVVLWMRIMRAVDTPGNSRSVHIHSDTAVCIDRCLDK